jgi:large subunit ribosomal protein L4
MEVTIANIKNEKLVLNDSIWNTEFEADVVAQAVNVYMSNQRKGSSKAKTKGEVAGGGKKPWKQKGTGRARAGSIRSPLWAGGGVTFGPTGLQSWSRKMNKKANVLAMSMVFAKQLADKKIEFVAIDSDIKSEDVRKVVTSGINQARKTLVVSDNKSVAMYLRNMENVEIVNTKNLNVYQLAKVSKILVDSKTIENIENILKV